MTNLQITNSIPEKKSNKFNRTHSFHLVEPSSLPFLVSFTVLSVFLNFVMYLHPNYFLIKIYDQSVKQSSQKSSQILEFSYIIFSIVSGIIGTFMSIIIRLELSVLINNILLNLFKNKKKNDKK